jgi:diacylglycerol kinase family enzyme
LARRLKRAILVYNRTAGDGRHCAEEWVELLRDAGYAAAIVDAKCKRSLRALPETAGTIFAAGGDGTVQRVARRIVGCRRTLAILPLGTANNIARSLGIDIGARAMIAGLEFARSRKVDLGVAIGPWGKRVFVEGVGGGIFADTMASLDAGRRRTAAGRDKNRVTRFSTRDLHLEPALHALAEALPRYRPRATEVSIDGRRMTGRFLMIEALNRPYFGPNLRLGPDIELDDGRLDFVLLDEAGRAEFGDYLAHRIDGGSEAPALTSLRGRRLEFVWAGPRLHIDDKAIATAKGRGAGREPVTVKIAVKPGALRLLVPAAPAPAAGLPSASRRASKS